MFFGLSPTNLQFTTLARAGTERRHASLPSPHRCRQPRPRTRQNATECPRHARRGEARQAAKRETPSPREALSGAAGRARLAAALDPPKRELHVEVPQTPEDACSSV